MNLSNIAILNIHSAYYRFTNSGISKSETIKVMPNIDLIQREEHYKTLKFIFTYKMDKEILAFGDVEIEKDKFYSYKSHIF